jgi:Methylamine utilisation protein MauE
MNTDLYSWLWLDPGIGRAIITLALAATIGGAGVWKISHRWNFMASMMTWGLSSRSSARTLSRVFPLLELAIVGTSLTLLASGADVVPATLPMSALLATFVLGQIVILLRTRAAECGCGPKLGLVGFHSIARTSSMLFVSLAVMLF